MTYGSFIPYCCPVKFYPLGWVRPAQYNFTHMDQDWFFNQVQFWPFNGKYFQKWQIDDTAWLQCITNGISPVTVQIVTQDGIVRDTITLSSTIDPSISSPYQLYQGGYSWATTMSSYTDQAVYMVMNIGTGSTVIGWISEPMMLATTWPVTLFLQASDIRNRQSTVFTTGYNPGFRVEGWLDGYMPGANFTQFEDQPADMVMLDAIPYDTFTLNIGDGYGIPPWVIKLIDRYMYLSGTTIDGVGFTRDKEAKMEISMNTPGWPMNHYKMKIRHTTNADGVFQTITGAPAGVDMDNEFNLNFAVWGTGTNMAQVTKVGIW